MACIKLVGVCMGCKAALHGARRAAAQHGHVFRAPPSGGQGEPGCLVPLPAGLCRRRTGSSGQRYFSCSLCKFVKKRTSGSLPAAAAGLPACASCTASSCWRRARRCRQRLRQGCGRSVWAGWTSPRRCWTGVGACCARYAGLCYAVLRWYVDSVQTLGAMLSML